MNPSEETITGADVRRIATRAISSAVPQALLILPGTDPLTHTPSSDGLSSGSRSSSTAQITTVTPRRQR